jgi:hypothetical protein
MIIAMLLMCILIPAIIIGYEYLDEMEDKSKYDK